MSPVPPGSLRLWDAVAPALPAGLYRLRSSLEIVRTQDGSPLSPPPPEQAHLSVTGLRFTLGPDEVAERHPPENAVGAFGERLPHVTLTRRSLPWERRLAGGEPWLAVLVARADEAELRDPAPLRTAVGASVFARLHARQPIEGNGPEVRTLAFRSGDTLRSVLPAKEELALLAHVRQVNVADSAVAGADDDGWFAVVAANRLPLAGPEPTPYVAALVSLEERDDVFALPPGAAAPPLVALSSWTFTSSAGGTFEHLVRSLDAAAFGAAAGDEGGAVTLEHTSHAGRTTPARYAPPFLAEAPAADHALPSDPGDLTAEAVFELGRMLAAADGRFLREVVGWHRSAADAAANAALREDVLTALATPAPAAGAAAVPADAGPDVPLAPATAARLLGRLAASARPADPWQVPASAADLAAAAPRERGAAAAGAAGARLDPLATARAAAAAEER